MINRKPLPLNASPTRAICPHCGTTSYSAGGVHPQCSVRAADQEWTERMKAKRAALAVLPDKAVKFYQRSCPKCQVVQHVRAKTCECGYIYPLKSQTVSSS